MLRSARRGRSGRIMAAVLYGNRPPRFRGGQGKSDEERRAHARDNLSGVPRTSRKHIDAQAEDAGMTVGDQMRGSGWEGKGEMNHDDWIAFCKKVPGYTKQKMERMPEGFGKIVDVSSRDIGHIAAVEKALGLSPNDRVRTVGSYEELRDEIKKFEAQRDVDMVSSGSRDIVMPMFEKFLAKKDVGADHSKNAESSNKNEEDEMIDAADVDDEEKERMKKRRSSMVSAELLMEELGGRGSSSSEGDDKDGARKLASTMKARRSSLIMTGKI